MHYIPAVNGRHGAFSSLLFSTPSVLPQPYPNIHKYYLIPELPLSSITMTNRNLNGNWIDTLSRQYTYDLLDNSPHPIIYHLYNPQKQKDLYYLIPTKIEEPQLRRSLVQYHQQTKNTDTLTWENEFVKVYPHPRYTEPIIPQQTTVSSSEEAAVEE